MPSAAAPASPKPKFGKELLVRTVSALVLAPLALYAVWAGGLPYLVLIGLLLAIGLHEWLQMTKFSLLGLVGLLYLSINLLAFYQVRLFPEVGRELTLYILLSVWAVDIGAYFSGRTFGGPKLAPRFSPSKTWAGLFGGMVAAAFIGYLWANVAGARIPEAALLLGLAVGVIAQTGDILESALKRRYGVKDSGHLIPGHGGILDRIDGLLLAVPIFTAFQLVIGQNLGWW